MRALRPYLFQGNITDLNMLPRNIGDFHSGGPTVAEKYDITLAINVGSTPFVPRDLPTVYLPMFDDPKPKANDWRKIINVLRLAVEEIHLGGKVFLNCDAGISRSIIFAGMLIAVIERRPMDDELMQEIRSPVNGPLLELWKNANDALITWWLG